MTTIYEFGADYLWTFSTSEIGDDEGVKGNWTRVIPPALGEDEFARWSGGRWDIVTSEVLYGEYLDAFKVEITNATQKQLDDFARTRNYDGILSACTYAADTNPTFSVEGQYCVILRGETWATLYQMLDEVQAGTRPIPETVEDVLALLPVPEWP